MENLLLLRDLLGPWKTRFLSTWQLFQKNVYFDVLDDIVNKYNKTVHRSIKMKPIDVISDSSAEYNEDSNVTKAFLNTEAFLLKDTLKIGQKKFLFAKLKIQFRGHTWLETWMVNQLLKVFMKKNCKKQIKKNLE